MENDFLACVKPFFVTILTKQDKTKTTTNGARISCFPYILKANISNMVERACNWDTWEAKTEGLP